MTTEYKRQTIASKNGETFLWKRVVLLLFLKKSNNDFFFLIETSITAVLQGRKGLNQNDKIRLER